MQGQALEPRRLALLFFGRNYRQSRIPRSFLRAHLHNTSQWDVVTESTYATLRRHSG